MGCQAQNETVHSILYYHTCPNCSHLKQVKYCLNSVWFIMADICSIYSEFNRLYIYENTVYYSV